MIEALGFLIAHKVVQGLITSIPLYKPKVGQLVKGHFANDSFLTILEEKESMANTMKCLHTFSTAPRSKIHPKLTTTCKVPDTYLISYQTKGVIGVNQGKNFSVLGTKLYGKWIIQDLEGIEAWKVLLHNYINEGTPFGNKSWSRLNLHNLNCHPNLS
jgi:hypothetical protein